MDIKKAMQNEGVFEKGALFLVDGQFGSTGKGLAAAVLAEHFSDEVKYVQTNAGPNSGHTSYYGDRKIVLKQLPTFSVQAQMRGRTPFVMLNAGAIIDLHNLGVEMLEYGGYVMVHENAAIVSHDAKELEKSLVSDIGSTGKGTGAALAAKIMRQPKAVAKDHWNELRLKKVGKYSGPVFGAKPEETLVEVSQGFSLSLNVSHFYPHTTSRDCTVAQAMSDAALHPMDFGNSMMVVRTYPIRVAGNSGPGYADQIETSWGELGVEPERTTVTNKVRRVFTWSNMQFMDALRANRPDFVLLNFMNYLDLDERGTFAEHVVRLYESTMGKKLPLLLLGYGPKVEDVEVFNGRV